MNKVLFASLVFIFVFLQLDNVFAWEGMPTPQLHVEGNKLKDPTGKDVLLHGWMQPTSSWFNGNRWYNDPSNWLDKNNVSDFLNMMKEIATLMTDTTPRYGADHGWYASFVRMNTDAIGGWNSTSGLTDTVQFNAWINNFLVPYTQFLSSRGLYLVLSATGPMNTPNNGSRNAGVKEQQRLRKFWSTVASAPGVKNANNIMFELMNEPVDVESVPGNGDWGNHQDKYYSAFTNWMQPVIDDIRNTGANNIIWVPTLEWQGTPMQWVKYPFKGSNIGVACHYYPTYGGVSNNHAAVQNLWDVQYKPAADRWPMMITEMFWTPYPNEPTNLVNGTTTGFGTAVKKAIDNQGNVSYIVGFIGDLIEDMGKNRPNECHLSPREGSQSYFEWLPTYTKFGPDDGTPKLKSATIVNSNPKQIKLILSHALNNQVNYEGFSVKSGFQNIEIETIAMGDSANQLLVNLTTEIKNDNDIFLSYSNGNVVSIYEKNLAEIENAQVMNLLNGSSPVLIFVESNEEGDKVTLTFNKKMLLPANLSHFSIKAENNPDKSFSFLSSSFLNADSTSLVFSLSERVYADYKLVLAYVGNSMQSADGGLLKDTTNIAIQNSSTGLPVQMVSGKTGTDGVTAFVEFSKPMEFSSKQLTQLELKVNGNRVSLTDFFILNRKEIKFYLSNTLHFGDTVAISYNTGDIKAADKGSLVALTDMPLKNNTSEPQWVSLPRKIEAEKYLMHSGTQTENTNDEGGGLDVGWIDNGDWLEYAINNGWSTTNFQITLRIASPSGNGRIDYYIDGKLIGNIAVPSTGGWQTWKSIVGNISIPSGKHYLKLVTTRGGFNLNYFDLKVVKTGVDQWMNNKKSQNFAILPNPVSNELVINADDFAFTKVEVVDMLGKTVISKSIEPSNTWRMPISLANGIYNVRISDGREYKTSKMMVRNQ
jgi:hypothetical protein